MQMRGFLVIFLLVVITVFFLYVVKRGGKPQIQEQVDAFAEVKEKTTRTNMSSLEKAIDIFIAQNGRVPNDLKEIQTFSRSVYIDTDSWGNKMQYKRISDLKYQLISAGKDKIFQTDDDIVVKN